MIVTITQKLVVLFGGTCSRAILISLAASVIFEDFIIILITIRTFLFHIDNSNPLGVLSHYQIATIEVHFNL